MTTIIYGELLLFDVPLHYWILGFGIACAFIGIAGAIANEEWLWGARKYHRHLIQKSMANRILISAHRKVGASSSRPFPPTLTWADYDDPLEEYYLDFVCYFPSLNQRWRNVFG